MRREIIASTTNAVAHPNGYSARSELSDE